MEEQILKELQEIKKLLQVIASNQEQGVSIGTVTVRIKDLEEYKSVIEELKS